jgi:ribA/ribD-fused uncharacterized protein
MIDRFEGTQYFFLSNFYPCRILYQGSEFACSENAFQAMKTIDLEERKKFTGMHVSPADAKAWGRSLSDLRPDWESVKDGIMYEILLIKFADPKLRKKLLDTGDQELVEGNWWGDQYWGVSGGHGKNMLGKTLMRVRDEIRKTK